MGRAPFLTTSLGWTPLFGPLIKAWIQTASSVNPVSSYNQSSRFAHRTYVIPNVNSKAPNKAIGILLSKAINCQLAFRLTPNTANTWSILGNVEPEAMSMLPIHTFILLDFGFTDTAKLATPILSPLTKIYVKHSIIENPSIELGRTAGVPAVSGHTAGRWQERGVLLFSSLLLVLRQQTLSLSRPPLDLSPNVRFGLGAYLRY